MALHIGLGIAIGMLGTSSGGAGAAGIFDSTFDGTFA